MKDIEPFFWAFLVTMAVIVVIAVKVLYGF